jgi:hypothetical protein
MKRKPVGATSIPKPWRIGTTMQRKQIAAVVRTNFCVVALNLYASYAKVFGESLFCLAIVTTSR